MKSIFRITTLVLLLSFALSSCKKNQTGGKGSLKGTVLHNGKAISAAYVYIKFNSTDFPGDDYKSYDTYVQADANGNFSISFYKGSYYVYATGLDLSIPYPYTVKGGMAITLKNKENANRNIDVY